MAVAFACYRQLSMQLETATHAELVQRVAGGVIDREVEAEVCRRFAPRIRLYGLKHLRDEEAAKDLVQRVLVVVIEALRAGRIEEPQHFDRFVLGTCRNTAHRVRAAEHRAQPTDPADLEIVDDAKLPERFGHDALLACMYKLDMRAKTVLQLSFYRERSTDEIAAALEMTAGNVRVVRHRAMLALRDCLERSAA